MIVLDENVPEDQRHTLRAWHIRPRQIGLEVGHSGMSDAEIVRLLRTLTRPTFFTRDRDFLQPWLRHASYCVVYLDVGQYEVASFVRRTLRHRGLNTAAKRMGTVVRVGHDRLAVWRVGRELERLEW